MLELCEAAKIVDPSAEAPCRHLKFVDGDALCGLVLKEKAGGLPPILEALLGVGTGCSMADESTTDEELDEQDEQHRIQLRRAFQRYGKLAVIRAVGADRIVESI